MPEDQFYENRSLFSDYYLEHRLTDHPEWDESVEKAYQSFQDLYQQNTELYPKLTGKEAKTEEKFIKPAFDILGFYPEVQDKAESYGELNFPDYSLFVSEEQRTEALQHLDESEYFNYPVAIADAKYWDRPLDSQFSDAEERLSNRNPSFQIVHYLVATGVEWGILTNGAVWRLYSTRARSRVDTYFEVNLQTILEEEDREAFKFFYHFFRAASFVESPETGDTFIERVFTGSIQYGSELQNRLKELIFDEIFLHLAEGFIEFQQKNGTKDINSPENLDDIYEGTLRLLYRLLFILYAEARDLLPVQERGYQKYSMMHLKRRAWKAVREGETLSRVGHDYWNDLQSLFRIIDLGDSDLNVPRYNGGLFRQNHPQNAFFIDHSVPDKYLVPALHLLTMDEDPETGEKRFIDYKTLDVEQLGSIYEGLLEFHLRIADEPLAVTKEKGREVYKPVDEVDKPLRIIEQGEPYLENDKGERKATGSYYTPEYIVQYIVENTVGPVLEDRAAKFAELMEEIKEKSSGNRKQPVKQLEQEAINTFLGIKICDPAMGSGHFLVRTTDYLAEHIIVELDKYPDNPVIRRLESIRQDIIETLEEQDISIDERVLKDTNLLKRMVMKRCIYGVDLNPMATELAKLSLWLDSFTVGAPLSFLDHHLKVGNSLIGTTVHEVEEALEPEEGVTEDLFGSPFRGLLQAANLMRDVSALTDATFSEVEQSISKYDAFEQAIQPYKTILDLWVSRHFGNDGVKQVMEVHGQDVLDALKQGSRENLHTSENESLQLTEALSGEHHFFHWELEFPEVFINLERSDWKENPGFDAVVGNPPYSFGRDWGQTGIKNYFNAVYKCSKYQIDLYQLFTEQGIRINKSGGYFSHIVPDTWTNAIYSDILRKFILKQTEVLKITSSDIQIFPDATVDTIIFLFRNSERHGSNEVSIQKFTKDLTIHYLYSISVSRFEKNENSLFNFWLSPEIETIINKIRSNAIVLSEVCETTRGINAYDKATGQSEEVISNREYHAEGKIDDSFVPELMGKDIGRYENRWDENHYIKYGKWLAAPREIRFFKSPKLLVRKLLSAGRIVSIVDYDEFFVDQQLYIGIPHNKNYNLNYLCSICNSKLISFVFNNEQREEGVSFPHLRVDAFDNLKIRKIDFTSSNSERESGLKEFTELHSEQIETAQFDKMLELVSGHLSASPERSGVVHDILAHLAQQMLHMHEQKQDETSGFLSWLERFMGTALENLSGYTIIQEYYDIDGGKEELIDRLKRNNSKIPDADMTARAAQEKVIEEYEKSMETLRPLLDRIEKTDTLIDRIVYQLYGLTEEEIRVVEDSP
ncbi:MAG: Eco57I restriction-modification methylase domain-containing protein [Candidatus Marinimicrobia bacterium]|nr:Eco57I restriction-modification methylase domain-containing protein [Candidatus Neomarinimicrobiota bacterium]MCF7830191.1 Eco57I restriction-modification methylase domain-containing protein [Candidatus Neomarinimicrobiota bacterium]MCF7882075.1 Eco57I restriction-modification methylase domain-containing protein [Candidatus Neomarinimicrobiota bacterium]